GGEAAELGVPALPQPAIREAEQRSAALRRERGGRRDETWESEGSDKHAGCPRSSGHGELRVGIARRATGRGSSVQNAAPDGLRAACAGPRSREHSRPCPTNRASPLRRPRRPWPRRPPPLPPRRASPPASSPPRPRPPSAARDPLVRRKTSWRTRTTRSGTKTTKTTKTT